MVQGAGSQDEDDLAVDNEHNLFFQSTMEENKADKSARASINLR